MTELTLKVSLDAKTLGIVEQIEYLAFFVEYVTNDLGIDPDEDFGLNWAWEQKTGKPVPDFKDNG